MEATQASHDDGRQHIADFMQGFTVETTPGAAAKIADFRDHLRPGARVYITFLAGSDFADTITVAQRLRDEGFEPIPHFAARSIANKNSLDDYLNQFVNESGVQQALVIAGAVDKPVGEFTDSMQLLETGLFDKHGIRKLGVAGHPEGSPDIADRVVAQALQWKNEFAERTDADVHLVTQFCFESAPIIEWDRRIQAEGNRLPIHIGIPGLATLKTLLSHAKACGIGPSMRFLSRQARNVARLMTVATPDVLVAELAAYRAADPACGIECVHVYPLGGLAKSAHWSYAVSDGDFRLGNDGKGFSVGI
ncbi:MAG: methylenetetrahydrofolate reductase [Gammaproteobacteria bacterium]